MNSQELIKQSIIEGWRICIYGLGLIGRNAGDLFLEYLHLKADLYCDRNMASLSGYPEPDEKKISFSDLIQIDEDMLVFVFLGRDNYLNAISALSRNTRLHLITYYELVNREDIIKAFFGIDRFPNADIPAPRKKVPGADRHYQGERIAIYTCITEDYDTLLTPTCVEEKCDYYLITDKKPNEHIDGEEYYRRIYIGDVMAIGNHTPKDQNRFCKMHSYSIFPEYKYSIYLDGNIQIIGELSRLVSMIGEYGILFYDHPYSSDPYAEALGLTITERIKKEEASAVVNRFIHEGIPRFIGGAEASIIMYENDNPIVHEFCDCWYDNYLHGEAKRDQLYLPYTLYQMGIPVNDVKLSGENWRANGLTRQNNVHGGYQ